LLPDGTITMTDFLNDTDTFKKKLVAYGLSSGTSTVFLNSEIRILEIYKELKFTDKLKEKDLSDPNELTRYLISNNSDIYKKKDNVSLVAANEDYQVSTLICNLSKR
jgi:hypothetical protein